MFGLPGGMEWVILAIIALLVFGGSRLANAGKNAGKAIKDFKAETSLPSRAAASADPVPDDTRA